MKVFKVTGLFAFLVLNLFFFQNCSQPFEALESSSTLELKYAHNSKPPRIGDYYAYGDMLVNAHDLEKINEDRAEDRAIVQSISIGISGNSPWPGGEIPIRVVTDNPNDFTPEELALFRQGVFAACELWAQEVNISCVPYTQQFPYLEAVLTKNLNDYCGSSAGACATYPTSNGIRRIYANHPSDELSGTMVHEFGHTLGLMHEHQHNEMDQYYLYPSTDPTMVTLGFHVLPFKYSNYHSKFGLFPIFNTEYDPQSIMHYRSLEKYGIIPKPGFHHFTTLSKYGSATGPSKGKVFLTVNDILGAQKIYGSKPGSKPICLEPNTGLPYFFENTMKGYFDKKMVSENGEKCKLENRFCKNGQLSGTFTELVCQEVCVIADDVSLQKGETKTVYIKNTTSDKTNNQWDQFEATCKRAGYMTLKDPAGNTTNTHKLENIHLSIPPTIEPKSYTWNVMANGTCSASPSYSYGSWSTCASDSTQTRSAQCVNTSGSQPRLVTCKDSTGKNVADSFCAGQTKPATSVSCTANCTGSPVTSQACTYQKPVTIIGQRACINKNLSYYQTLLRIGSTGQEYTLTNPLKITDGKVIQHSTRNTTGSGNIVIIQKNAHYSLMTYKNDSGAATVPSSIVLEGNAADYLISKESSNNQVTIGHKSCGEVMRYSPQGSGSTTMFISFKNCTARLNHSFTQQGTIWQFIGGDKITEQSLAKEITGCTPHSEVSPAPGLHLTHFGW